MDPATVTVSEGGFAQMPDLLRSKQVDAVLATEPFLSRMIDGGIGRRVDYVKTSGDFLFSSFFIAKRSWVDAHKKELEAVRAAMRAAVLKAKAEPAFAKAVAAKYLKLPAEVLAKQKPYDWRVDVTPEDVKVWIDLGVELGLVQQPLTPQQILA